MDPLALLLLISLASPPSCLTSDLTEQLEETRLELDVCQKKLNEQSYLGSVCSKVGTWLTRDTSLKSSVVKFLDKLSLLSPSQAVVGVERDVTVVLTSQDIKSLKRFALHGEGSPDHVEQILLNSLIVRETILDRTTDFFSQTFAESSMHIKANYVIIFQVLVLLLCVVLPLCLGSHKLPVFLLMCLYAVFTTWVKLYYTAAAKKQATLAKLGNIPNSCLLEKQGWMAAVGDFVGGLLNGRQDPCEEYYTAAMVDPAWEVGLVAAVMETVSVCVIIPAETIGTAMGSYYTCLLQPLPWVWKLPVLLLATLSLLFLLLLLCGYEFTIPFLLRIGPNKQSKTINNEDNGMIEDRNHQQLEKNTDPPFSGGGFIRHPSQECDMTDKGTRITPYPQHKTELDHIIEQATK